MPSHAVGLVVGRFQPLHNGHVALIRQAIASCEQVKIAVGSSQYQDTEENPFSYWDRVAMLHAALGRDGDHIEVYAVPDLHDPPRWVRHLDAIVGPYDVVFGNDEGTMALFRASGAPVHAPGLMERRLWSGKTIRRQWRSGASGWVDAVPAPVAALMEAHKGPSRTDALPSGP